MNKQKNLVNIILVVVAIAIVAVSGYFVLSKKSTTIVPAQTSSPVSLPTTSAEQIKEFEEAVNNSDFNNASKYFADNVYVVLEGSSCCGEVSASRAKQELERISGLTFTFNLNDPVVKEYMDYMATEYPNRRFIKNIPNKLYFDELVIGVESDISQLNKASIGYKISNNKITNLFVNIGRDR